MSKEITIWSSKPNYEVYKEALEQDFPALSEEERMEILEKANEKSLAFQKLEMSQKLGNSILVMEKIENFYEASKTIASGNLADCFQEPQKDQKCRWFVDEKKDLHCENIQNGQKSHYLYRLLKSQSEEKAIYSKEELEEKTLPIGDAINDVYGIL